MILYLYTIAIHTSMALMEIFGWIAVVYGAYTAFSKGPNWGLDFFRRNRRILCVLLMLVVWVGVSLLATPLEKPFLMQFGFMRWVLLLIGLTFAVANSQSEDFDRRWIQIWSVVFLITGAYAALQMLTGWDFIRPGRGLVNPQGSGLYKAIGFFSMSLTFAYAFGVSAFAIIGVSKRVCGRYVQWLLFLVAAMGILSSMSRGAWLAGILVFGFYLFSCRRRLLWPFLAVLFVGISVAVLLDDAIGYKILQVMGLRADNSAHTRVDLWRGYWQMFLDHPIFGVGIFEGDKLLPEYFSQLHIDQPFHSHAHNVYLQWLAGTGILGFLLYMYVAWYFLRSAWRLRLKESWGWGLFMAQAFLHIGALTEANFFDGEVNHGLILVWAITWARRENLLKEGAQPTSSDGKREVFGI